MDRKSEIAANLAAVEVQIADALRSAARTRSEITLIAVTKNFPVTDVELLYELGIRDFGENRDQEAREKVAYFRERGGGAFPDMRWHFQGQLQRNKLGSIGSWADMVHSVDDVKYLQGLSDAAVRNHRHIRTLIQLSLDEEPSPGRGGTDLAGALEIISAFERARSSLSGISIDGVMGVAPVVGEPAHAFALLADRFRELSQSYPELSILSAGMSGDFAEAIGAGATHIRIGSSILGSRH